METRLFFCLVVVIFTLLVVITILGYSSNCMFLLLVFHKKIKKKTIKKILKKEFSKASQWESWKEKT